MGHLLCGDSGGGRKAWNDDRARHALAAHLGLQRVFRFGMAGGDIAMAIGAPTLGRSRLRS
jgi:hypothetical protein